MINITVNGLTAHPREDLDFEYVAENNFFSSSDGYTLSIEFPLRGCPENIAVFGHLHRDDVAKYSVLMASTVQCGKFFKSGSLSVVDVDDSSVKCQFLEGVKPDEEELSVDTLYLDELDLGSFPVLEAKDISPKEARVGTDNEVCYPWLNVDADVVNNMTDPRIAKADDDDSMQWHEDTVYLSWQPYLKVILRRVAAAAGYSIDLSSINYTDWNKVIICNSVPGTWQENNYATALPHWKIADFFKNLGMIMKGSFTFDHSTKSIKFEFYSSSVSKIIELDDVADEYQASITRDEDDADFLPIMRLRYPESDAVVWKYLDCPWILDSWRLKKDNIVFNTLQDYEALPSRGRPEIYYIKDLDCWLTHRAVQMYAVRTLPDKVADSCPWKYIAWKEKQPLNVFGPPDYDEDEKYDSLECSPVPVDYSVDGKVMWLPFSGNSNVAASVDNMLGSDSPIFGYGQTINGDSFSNSLNSGQDRLTHDIVSHTDEKDSALYDKIYLGMVSPDPLRFPYPITDIDFFRSQKVGATKIFRLSRGCGGVEVDPEVKYTFKFLADSIPDTKAIFLIHGQKYICRKITASFSRFGMSRILKGEFFRCL